jgi:hypothetical protein
MEYGFFEEMNPVMRCQAREQMLRALMDKVPSQVRHDNDVLHITSAALHEPPGDI